MQGKYFIWHNEKLYPASAHNFLCLIGNNNPEIAKKIKFYDLRLEHLNSSLPETDYELITKDIIYQNFINRFNDKIQFDSNTAKIQKEKNAQSIEYKNILDSIHLLRKHLSDEQIASIIDNMIVAIQSVDDDKMTEFLNNVHAELTFCHSIKKPPIEQIYQSKRTEYVYKNLLSSLETLRAEHYYHTARLDTGDGATSYNKDDRVNAMIQEDIDAKNIEYEISQVKQEFYSKLLEGMVVIYPEVELYNILKAGLKESNAKGKNKLLFILDNLHNNQNIDEDEKIFRYLLLLFEHKKNPSVNKLLSQYFFTENRPLFVNFLAILLVEKKLHVEYNNTAQAALQHFSEKRPALYKMLMSFIDKNQQHHMVDIHRMAAAANILLSKIDSISFFFENSLKDDANKERKTLHCLNQFYLGKSSISDIKAEVKDSIQSAYQQILANKH